MDPLKAALASPQCKICNNSFATREKLFKHLKDDHCIAPQSYSDQYLLARVNHQIIDETILKGGKTQRDSLVNKKLRFLYQRELETFEIPYHIDFNKTNESISNLAILPFIEIHSKKTGAKSRAKGKRKEREVAHLIQEWWKIGEFRPAPESGAWDRGGHFKMKGDIVATDDKFPFCIEIKNREDWKFSVSVSSDRSALHRCWEQTLRESAEAKLEPMLLFTRNYHPLFMAIKSSLATKLKPMFGFALKLGIMDCYITLFDEFLKHNRDELVQITSQI